MKSRKLIATLLLTLLLLISPFSPSAQTEAGLLKKRISEQIAFGTHPQPVENVEFANRVLASPEEQGRGLLDILARQKNLLLGTWNLTLTFSDGSQAKSTLSVFPGRTNGEGSVLHSAEASLLLPNPTLPEQGVWQHNGALQFIASYRGYAVDEKFQQPAGQIGFRHLITLNPDQETFIGRAVFEVFDSAGQLVFSDNVQTQGVRQRAVAP